MIEETQDYAGEGQIPRSRQSAESFSNDSCDNRDSIEVQDGESSDCRVRSMNLLSESTWSLAHEEMVILPKNLIKNLCERCAVTIAKYSMEQSETASGHPVIHDNRVRLLSESKRRDLTIQPSSSDALLAIFTLERTEEGGLIGVHERLEPAQEATESLDAEDDQSGNLLFLPRGRILHEHILKPADSQPMFKSTDGVRSSSSVASRRDSQLSKITNVRVRSSGMSDCSNGLLDLLLNQVDGNFRCSSLHKLQEETGIKFAKPFQLLTKMVAQREAVDEDIDLLIEQWNSKGYIDGDLFVSDQRNEGPKGDERDSKQCESKLLCEPEQCEYTPEGFDSQHFATKQSIRWTDGFCVHDTSKRERAELDRLQAELHSQMDRYCSPEYYQPNDQSGNRRSLNDHLHPDLPTRSVLRRPTDWQLVSKHHAASQKPTIKTTMRRISFSELPQLHESKALPRVPNRRSYLQSVMQAAAREHLSK